jgi:hypothetical protein
MLFGKKEAGFWKELHYLPKRFGTQVAAELPLFRMTARIHSTDE